MPSTLDCAICIMRQALEAARFATDDVDKHAKILETAMRITIDAGMKIDPPWVGTLVHRAAREISGDHDPYLKEKKRFNRYALARIDDLRRWIQESRDPFETTVRLAIAGNSIDFAMESISEAQIDDAIRRALDQPLVGDLDELQAAISDANRILYLTDNAGEIVCDRLLIEMLLSPEFGKEVVVATRGKPILNDALYEDAEEAGITRLTRVVGNGGDGLGTIFSLTSREFQREFRAADLVIAKGLANYETLRAPRQGDLIPKALAMLFKAKCHYIAEEVGAQFGDLIVQVRRGELR